jgi:acetolactate synthase-1/2/3 large subunit
LADVERAARIIGQARRPLVLSGRGALGARTELVQFLDRTGAVYIDTQESRNLVPAEHPSIVGTVRAKAMRDADVVIVVGRKLDYQTAYGSPSHIPMRASFASATTGKSCARIARRGRAVRASRASPCGPGAGDS